MGKRQAKITRIDGVTQRYTVGTDTPPPTAAPATPAPPAPAGATTDLTAGPLALYTRFQQRSHADRPGYVPDLAPVLAGVHAAHAADLTAVCATRTPSEGLWIDSAKAAEILDALGALRPGDLHESEPVRQSLITLANTLLAEGLTLADSAARASRQVRYQPAGEERTLVDAQVDDSINSLERVYARLATFLDDAQPTTVSTEYRLGSIATVHDMQATEAAFTSQFSTSTGAKAALTPTGPALAVSSSNTDTTETRLTARTVTGASNTNAMNVHLAYAGSQLNLAQILDPVIAGIQGPQKARLVIDKIRSAKDTPDRDSDTFLERARRNNLT